MKAILRWLHLRWVDVSFMLCGPYCSECDRYFNSFQDEFECPHERHGKGVLGGTRTSTPPPLDSERPST